jgi:hypothetical protein
VPEVDELHRLGIPLVPVLEPGAERLPPSSQASVAGSESGSLGTREPPLVFLRKALGGHLVEFRVIELHGG